MIRRPPRSTHRRSSAASDVYKRQVCMCKQACVFLCLSVGICVGVGVCLCASLCICTHMCMHARIHVCLHLYGHTCGSMWTVSHCLFTGRFSTSYFLYISGAESCPPTKLTIRHMLKGSTGNTVKGCHLHRQHCQGVSSTQLAQVATQVVLTVPSA